MSEPTTLWRNYNAALHRWWYDSSRENEEAVVEARAAIEAEACADAEATIQRLREALTEVIATTDNATDRGAADSQWLVRVGGLRAFHRAIGNAREVLADTAPEGEPLVPPPADPGLFGSDR